MTAKMDGMSSRPRPPAVTVCSPIISAMLSSPSFHRTLGCMSANSRRAPPVASARPRAARLPSASRAALLLASAAYGGKGPVAQAVLLRQLISLTRALSDMHAAAGEAQRAAELETVARRELALVSDRLTASAYAARPPADGQTADAARVARQGQLAPRPPGSPLPSVPDRPAPEPPPGVRQRDRDAGPGR